MFSGNKNLSKKILILLAAPFIVLLLGLGNANAYMCWGWIPSDVKNIKKTADAIFVGKINQIETLRADNDTIGDFRFRLTFDVDAVWKGENITKTPVFVYADSIYKYDFQLDKVYLVYGYKIHDDSRISIVGCPRVKPVENAAKEITYLGKAIYPEEFKVDEIEGYVKGKNIVIGNKNFDGKEGKNTVKKDTMMETIEAVKVESKIVVTDNIEESEEIETNINNDNNKEIKLPLNVENIVDILAVDIDSIDVNNTDMDSNDDDGDVEDNDTTTK